MNETAGLGVRILSTQLPTSKSVHTRLRKVRTLSSRQCLCLNGTLRSKRVVILERTPAKRNDIQAWIGFARLLFWDVTPERHYLQACISFAGVLFWDWNNVTPPIILRKRDIGVQ